jgi:hypothetical protein
MVVQAIKVMNLDVICKMSTSVPIQCRQEFELDLIEDIECSLEIDIHSGVAELFYRYELSGKELEDKKTESSEAIKDIQYLMKRPDVQEVWKNIIVQETLMGMPTGTGEYYPSIFNAAANKIADSIIQSFINTKVE